MGKAKGRKGRQTDNVTDDEEDLDIIAQAKAIEQAAEVPKGAAPVSKKGKKNKKNKNDNWDDDDAKNDTSSSKKSNGQDDEEKGTDDSDSDTEKTTTKKTGRGKKSTMTSAFAMLSMNDSDEDVDLSEDDASEEKAPPKNTNKKKQKKQDSMDMEENDSEEETRESKEPVPQPQKKKGKKEKKKKATEDEDIDAILAELEGKAPPSKAVDFKDMSSMTPDELAAALEAEYEEEDRKKKNKKGKKGAAAPVSEPKFEPQAEDGEPEEAEEKDEDDEEDKGSAVKTAAQKKKEKKERQKQKKLEEKSKSSKQGSKKKDVAEDTTEEGGTETKETDDVTKEAAGTPEPTLIGDEEEEVEEDSKKKKKKDKKKKGEKEEPKKKTSKMAKMILEQQQKLKEEEDRIRREQEEEERKAEELRLAKEEKKRKEEELRQKKKQEKQAKIAKQKAEGTYLTAKQKQEKQIALAKLAALGIQLPDEKDKKTKRPVYDNRKKKKAEQPKEETQPEMKKSEEEPEATKEEQKDAQPATPEEEDGAKDAWDAESEDDTKDAWDAESEDDSEETKDEDEPKPKETAKVKKQVSKDTEEESGSEEEDNDDEEEDETSSEEEESSSDEDDGRTAAERARDKAQRRIAKRKEEAEKHVTTDKLRAAVVCVLGHVDTGKTKILDKLRRTNVQDNEAGGITQQIGATNVPVQAIKDQTKMVKEFAKKELLLPGLLIIDTPGHESFSNLRTRGSSLCDIAILVVDIMHGLEAQTKESIQLLRARKCPFIVALNKIDRLYQWQSNPHTDIINQLKKQKQNTKLEFDERVDQVKLQFSELGLNVSLFHENPNPKEYISLVPTSAHSGDGMGNLIALICELTQSHLARRVAYSTHLQATVMEVKAIAGLGTTIDVIVVNGSLHEGETIIVPGAEGPIVTQIRGLLLPQPMKELRVKGAYDHVKEVVAAQGVKIIGKDLEKALAGLPMYVAEQPDEIEVYRDELSAALEDVLKSIKLQEKGVFVQASTLGSLEALLQFLRDSKIPYAGINIGPVHRRDVMKASVMVERDVQYACMLAFDVKVEREAQEMADSMGIRIFTADIIYHLFDAFTKYREEFKLSKQNEFKHLAVFPCKLRVLPDCVFKSRDPLVLGVTVEAGFVKNGSPICVPSKEFCYLGVVTSLEVNHKPVDKAVKGQEVCIKIENVPGETPKMFGRHFDESDMLISRISRTSIDTVKNYFRDEMGKGDWQLIIELKRLFGII